MPPCCSNISCLEEKSGRLVCPLLQSTLSCTVQWKKTTQCTVICFNVVFYGWTFTFFSTHFAKKKVVALFNSISVKHSSFHETDFILISCIFQHIIMLSFFWTNLMALFVDFLSPTFQVFPFFVTQGYPGTRVRCGNKANSY